MRTTPCKHELRTMRDADEMEKHLAAQRGRGDLLKEGLSVKKWSVRTHGTS